MNVFLFIESLTGIDLSPLIAKVRERARQRGEAIGRADASGFVEGYRAAYDAVLCEELAALPSPDVIDVQAEPVATPEPKVETNGNGHKPVNRIAARTKRK